MARDPRRPGNISATAKANAGFHWKPLKQLKPMPTWQGWLDYAQAFPGNLPSYLGLTNLPVYQAWMNRNTPTGTTMGGGANVGYGVRGAVQAPGYGTAVQPTGYVGAGQGGTPTGSSALQIEPSADGKYWRYIIPGVWNSPWNPMESMPSGYAASPKGGEGWKAGWNPRYGATQTGKYTFAEAYNKYGQPAGTQLGAYLQRGGPPTLGGSTRNARPPDVAELQKQLADIQSQLENFKFKDATTDVQNVSYGKLIGAGSSRRYKLLQKRAGLLKNYAGAEPGYGVSPAGTSGLTQWSV